jgi:sporulation protein YlmC with PRC-barrel domain
MRRSAFLFAALAVITQTSAQGLYSDLYEPGALPLSEIIGMEVVTTQGRGLGRISDLVFDSASGAIEEIAVGAARFPLSALLSGDEHRRVVIDPPPQSSAGATGLLALTRSQPAEASSAARSYASNLGPPEAVIVDLKEGRLRPQP